MKKFAFFLPQFHEIPENDEWWGKGFTEWTNVRQGETLFKGHVQPQKPLNNNYYNLLDKKTVKWQTDLMKQYGVDGLVYYHYYFCGKRLLEKPAENLLKWKDIEQPFFFCWANHTWHRSWNNSTDILIEQKYGNKKDWEEHFNYLLPFFRDERYEKKDNKPVLMLFMSDFKEKNDIISFFNSQCRVNGFDGICVIETYFRKNKKDFCDFEVNKSDHTDFIYIREPDAGLNAYRDTIKYFPEKIVRKFSKGLAKITGKKWLIPYKGNQIYRYMPEPPMNAKNIAHGIFFEWDNTPRHSLRGYVITPPSKEKFFEYMNSIKDDEYVFINAWNEWAEGMVLEPTEHNKYKYLEWIKEWVEKYGE